MQLRQNLEHLVGQRRHPIVARLTHITFAFVRVSVKSSLIVVVWVHPDVLRATREEERRNHREFSSLFHEPVSKTQNLARVKVLGQIVGDCQ